MDFFMTGMTGVYGCHWCPFLDEQKTGPCVDGWYYSALMCNLAKQC